MKRIGSLAALAAITVISTGLEGMEQSSLLGQFMTQSKEAKIVMIAAAAATGAVIVGVVAGQKRNQAAQQEIISRNYQESITRTKHAKWVAGIARREASIADLESKRTLAIAAHTRLATKEQVEAAQSTISSINQHIEQLRNEVLVLKKRVQQCGIYSPKQPTHGNN